MSHIPLALEQVDDLVALLYQRTDSLFSTKHSHIREGAAAALGFGSHAAMQAHVRDGRALSTVFDHNAYGHRLRQILRAWPSASAAAVVAEGVTVTISISADSSARSARYDNTQHEIELRVTCADGSPAGHRFLLPNFANGASERYRVASWWSHRAEPSRPDLAQTRFGTGRELMHAKFVDGVWKGAAFIYDHEMQADRSRWETSVRSALLRAALPGATLGMHCEIFKPDRYDHGAWRVEMHAGSLARKELWGGRYDFVVKPLPARNLIAEQGFRSGEERFRIVDGVWLGDLYTNGIEEARNPTSIDHVHAALMRSANHALPSQTDFWELRARLRS